MRPTRFVLVDHHAELPIVVHRPCRLDRLRSFSEAVLSLPAEGETPLAPACRVPRSFWSRRPELRSTRTLFSSCAYTADASRTSLS
eukprot:3336324-Heterocapsa_arctica.AAC.1